ncbi:NHL repeat-containing protein [Malonomonas rubra DSM 5091]|uniref:NHL repeat-containing protein n=1 Tax=Malonomonas rubra DSM 5091 TaxID=1122189 RepID=A0A1M6HZ07_MALRU|nr:hypothetical protein [Malonomonas rubra]SHJ27383.1 NHL repeat-containing protein [Malonomonas rubra DSM 5091]
MKNVLFIVLVAVLLTMVCQPAVAAQLRLRYAGSIYTDAEGGPLQHPAGVTMSGDRLLVADSGAKRVLTFKYAAGVVTPERVLPLPQNFPLMVELASNGDFYVLDGLERQVLILDRNGKQKATLKVKGAGDKRVVPRSFKRTPDGQWLLLDLFSSRVLLLDEAGSLQRELLFPDGEGFFSDVAVNPQGQLFLLDSVGGRIYRANKGEEAFTLWSDNLKDYTNFPVSLAATNGSLLLVDKYGSGLAVIGPDGGFSGRKLSTGWSDGQLYYPSQVSVGAEGQVFIADTENHRVQQFNIEE